ncbi:MAG: hypothetical protein NTX06_03180, partial [Proteobacteria bacterium]|nr:hypothetical protein [Pseudomonadota bacterium]
SRDAEGSCTVVDDLLWVHIKPLPAVTGKRLFCWLRVARVDMLACLCRQEVLKAIVHKKRDKGKKSDHAACGGSRQKTEEG